jgi:hypothetical protein
VGKARYAARVAAITVAHPFEAFDRIRGRIELARASAADLDLYSPASDWEGELHTVLGASPGCPCLATFEEVWARAEATLTRTGVGRTITLHDADPALARAVWLGLTHLDARTVVETGVARGLTSRVILEYLAQADRGHLWSVDLPPAREGWSSSSRAAVPRELRDRWVYRRGSSRRALPAVVSAVGAVDLFIHDSLHTGPTVAFELGTVWPALRPGGLAVVDDIQASDAFARFRVAGDVHWSAVARHDEKKDSLVGLLLKGPLAP